jgi:hypothetical protein
VKNKKVAVMKIDMKNIMLEAKINNIEKII